MKIFEIPDGQLEVELDGGALVLPLQRVREGDVDLGAVESPVARIQLPGQPQRVQRLG